jgi:hypothetical protein
VVHCLSMKYTQRDLDLAERHMFTFERFISRHRQLLAESAWDPELKAAAEKLLDQLEETLNDSRRRCEQIRTALQID